MEYTVEDIKNMSDEEIAELNKKLGIQVLKRYALLMVVKWTVIFTVTNALRRYFESIDKTTIKTD